ncbi:pilus assembly protein PilP [Parachitinimonas caeni]|uniref:Pilus assembly protein PilP n=1 Tax=Parachitinimonas caeni TaxID=3031301 RepID=A0ABT7DSC7_9NEIS|nr:pilus assembly protein PilP [Parachitinimonas caeni]MDK2122973.1 pilus assembly protein PilP [Parachitinimonas caeni]
MSKRISILLVALLAGCGGEQFGDLKEWMKENSQNLRGKVDPLPEVKPYQPFPYNAFDQVDPFRPVKMDVAKKGGGSLAPNFNRPKETLEAYDLEKLRMVGTLQRGKEIHALIKTPDGNLYRVKVGSYLGQNFGMISAITDTEVQIKEIVEDSGGDWVERSTQLTLEESEQKK